MKKQSRREDPVETMAAIVIVMLGLLILGGAFLMYQRASVRNLETPFQPVTQERGGSDGTLHIQLTFERDGQIFHSDGYLDHVHVVESVRSGGILYSYALDREIPVIEEESAPEEAPELPEKASETPEESGLPDNTADTARESNAEE